MAGTPVYGARWCFDAVGNIGDTSDRFDFSGDTVQKNQPLLFSQGLRGTRARQKEQSRQGPFNVVGSLTAEPTVAHLSYFLQWALGGGSATAPAFANALTLRDGMFDRVADVYLFSGLAMNRWRLSGRSGQLLSMVADLVGKTETAGQTYPSAGAALTSTITGEPLQCGDTGLTLYSTSGRKIEEFELMVDNDAKPKVRNTLQAQDIIPGPHRSTRFTCTSIFSATEASQIYGGNVVDSTGVFAITNSTVSCTFTFANLKQTKKTPIPGSDEFLLSFDADVLGTAGGAEFTCACDITP